MSDYLVNLARRSVGIAPVARPRSGPGPGPAAGLARGVEQPSAAATPVRGGSIAAADPSVGQGSPRQVEVEPSRDEAAGTVTVAPASPTVDGPAHVTRQAELMGRNEPRALGVADGASAVSRVADAPAVRIAPESRVPTVTGPSSPIRPVTAMDDQASDARREPGPERVRPDLEPRRGDVIVELPLPAASAAPRQTAVAQIAAIEPALAPAPLAGPRTVTVAGPGREIQVRIGTLEIHAGSDAPAPAAPPAAAAPAGAVASTGGFDDFVRLRSYAPWQR